MRTSNLDSAHISVYADPLHIKQNSKILFEILALEQTHLNKFHIKSQMRNIYEIIWIKKGSGRFRIDLKNQEISDNYIVLLSPGQHYKFESFSAIEGYRIRFSQEFICFTAKETYDLFQTGKYVNRSIFPAVKLDMVMQQEIENIVLNMIKEYSNYFKSRGEALQGLLKILMIHVSRKFDSGRDSDVSGIKQELVKKFMLMVDENFIKTKLVNDYACELAVTSNYLNDVIKKGTGFPASYHIHQRVILEAKRMAFSSSQSMKEIAVKLGYDDTSHFSKFFKINSGINFTGFKKQLTALIE